MSKIYWGKAVCLRPFPDDYNDFGHNYDDHNDIAEPVRPVVGAKSATITVTRAPRTQQTLFTTLLIIIIRHYHHNHHNLFRCISLCPLNWEYWTQTIKEGPWTLKLYFKTKLCSETGFWDQSIDQVTPVFRMQNSSWMNNLKLSTFDIFCFTRLSL